MLLFSLPGGGGGDAPLNGPAGQRGVRTGASSESSAAAAVATRSKLCRKPCLPFPNLRIRKT